MASTSRSEDSSDGIYPLLDSRPKPTGVKWTESTIDRMREEDIEEFVTNTFGIGRTESQIKFINALNETRNCSFRFVMRYLFTLWYITAVYVHYYAVRVPDKVIVRCEIPALEGCETFNFTTIISISVKSGKPTYKDYVSTEYCTYDDYNYQELVTIYGCNYDKIIEVIRKKSEPKQKPCDSLVKNIQTRYHVKSVKEEFDLHCNNIWNWLFWIAIDYGFVFSFPFVGFTADIYGKKSVFVVGSSIHLVGFLLLFIPWKWSLVFGRFLIGIGRAVQFILFLLFLEICGKDTYLGMGFFLLSFIFPAADTIVFILCFYVQEWKTIHLINTCMLLVLPFGIWYLTESPRWLMFIGSEVKAWEALQKCGSTAEPYTDNTETSTPEAPTVSRLWIYLRQPIFSQRLIVCTMLWFLTSTSRFIDTRPVVEDLRFGDNEIFFTLIAFVLSIQFGGYLVAIKIDRRTAAFGLYSMLMLLDSVVFIVNLNIKDSRTMVLILCCHMAVAEGVTHVLVLYTSELFPTPFRATAFCICLTFYGIGETTRHYIFKQMFNFKSNTTAQHMPTIFATAICTLLVSFLPKTQDKGLPDTAREALYLQSIDWD